MMETWNTTASTGAFNTDDMLSKMRRISRMQPYTAVVTTEAILQRLKAELEVKTKALGVPYPDGEIHRLYGLPVETYQTEAECVARAAHQKNAERVLLVLSDKPEIELP